MSNLKMIQPHLFNWGFRLECRRQVHQTVTGVDDAFPEVPPVRQDPEGFWVGTSQITPSGGGWGVA